MVLGWVFCFVGCHYKFATQGLITISKCFNFLLNNGFALFSTNNSIVKSYIISKD